MEDMSGKWFKFCITRFVFCTCDIQHLNNNIVFQCKEKNLTTFYNVMKNWYEALDLFFLQIFFFF
jgi:hypothetical protein